MTNGRDETEDFEATSANGGDRNECQKQESLQLVGLQRNLIQALQQTMEAQQKSYAAQQKLVEFYEELTNRNDTNNTNTNNTAKNNSNNTASNNSNNNNSPVQTDQDHSFQSPGSNEKSLIPEPAEDEENYLQTLEEDFKYEYVEVLREKFPGIKSVPISESDFDLVIKYWPTTKEEFFKIAKMDEKEFELYGVPLLRLCDKYKRLIAKSTTKEKRTRKGSKRPKKN